MIQTLPPDPGRSGRIRDHPGWANESISIFKDSIAVLGLVPRVVGEK
jgi:hypothetical protein